MQSAGPSITGRQAQAILVWSSQRACPKIWACQIFQNIHFRSKEEILIALHELGIEEALGTLLGQIDEAPSAVQLLRDMNERMAEWYENNRELACLFCSKRSIVDTSCATSSACDNLRRIILRAQDLGEFSRDLSADRIADLMILLYFNEKQSWIKNNFTTSLREGIRSCTHALFYGVVKR